MATHIDDFAAALRELKERSGRSYGQLAARLHVSTSTLHRYCNGAAVPAEYAPVERLARACGATPEELVALHRRWLLADAQRREPERTEPIPPAVTEAQPQKAQPAEVQPAEARPEAAQPRKARTEPADPETVESEAVESEVVDSETVASETAADTDALRRARRGVLVLGAVAAIAAVAVLPFALRTAGGGDAQNAGASSPLTGHSALPGGSGIPSPSRSLSQTPDRSPSPFQSLSPSPNATSSGGASRTAATADAGPSPFKVNVLADNWDMQCGQWFLMQQQPGQVPPPPSLEQTNAWASALGGVPAGHLRLQLTAQTGAPQPIVLHALYVHVVNTKPAPKGIVYTPGSGCGGGLDPASFAVDLDATVPRTKPVPGYVGQGTTSTLSDFPYQISGTDPQVLDVDASTTGQDVSWYLLLAWSSGDRHGTVRVDDHGHPFRTVGLQGDPAYFYDGTKWSSTTVG